MPIILSHILSLFLSISIPICPFLAFHFYILDRCRLWWYIKYATYYKLYNFHILNSFINSLFSVYVNTLHKTFSFHYINKNAFKSMTMSSIFSNSLVLLYVKSCNLFSFWIQIKMRICDGYNSLQWFKELIQKRW